MGYQLTEEQFLKDVADHRMTVIRNDGVYRHVRFAEPGTMCQHFDLLTWPGYLCYTGDMGTYVFSRLRDMFEFFRSNREERDGKKLFINLGYWAEKLQASDSNGRYVNGVKTYSPEKFERVVKEQLVEWLRETQGSEKRRALREAVEEDVLSLANEGDVRAFDAANDFEHEGYQFTDFWEHDLTEYTHRFVWCCYALAWGIQQYDAQYSPTSAEGETR